jgi:hypothetical protein
MRKGYSYYANRSFQLRILYLPICNQKSKRKNIRGNIIVYVSGGT